MKIEQALHQGEGAEELESEDGDAQGRKKKKKDDSSRLMKMFSPRKFFPSSSQRSATAEGAAILEQIAKEKRRDSPGTPRILPSGLHCASREEIREGKEITFGGRTVTAAQLRRRSASWPELEMLVNQQRVLHEHPDILLHPGIQQQIPQHDPSPHTPNLKTTPIHVTPIERKTKDNQTPTGKGDSMFSPKNKKKLKKRTTSTRTCTWPNPRNQAVEKEVRVAETDDQNVGTAIAGDQSQGKAAISRRRTDDPPLARVEKRVDGDESDLRVLPGDIDSLHERVRASGELGLGRWKKRKELGKKKKKKGVDPKNRTWSGEGDFIDDDDEDPEEKAEGESERETSLSFLLAKYYGKDKEKQALDSEATVSAVRHEADAEHESGEAHSLEDNGDHHSHSPSENDHIHGEEGSDNTTTTTTTKKKKKGRGSWLRLGKKAPSSSSVSADHQTSSTTPIVE